MEMSKQTGRGERRSRTETCKDIELQKIACCYGQEIKRMNNKEKINFNKRTERSEGHEECIIL